MTVLNELAEGMVSHSTAMLVSTFAVLAVPAAILMELSGYEEV